MSALACVSDCCIFSYTDMDFMIRHINDVAVPALKCISTLHLMA